MLPPYRVRAAREIYAGRGVAGATSCARGPREFVVLPCSGSTACRRLLLRSGGMEATRAHHLPQQMPGSTPLAHLTGFLCSHSAELDMCQAPGLPRSARGYI